MMMTRSRTFPPVSRSLRRQYEGGQLVPSRPEKKQAFEPMTSFCYCGEDECEGLLKHNGGCLRPIPLPETPLATRDRSWSLDQVIICLPVVLIEYIQSFLTVSRCRVRTIFELAITELEAVCEDMYVERAIVHWERERYNFYDNQWELYAIRCSRV